MKLTLENFTDAQIHEEFVARYLHKAQFTEPIRSSADARRTLIAAFANEEKDREHFVVVFLDAQHHVAKIETMFHGSIASSAVYPREIVKRVLAYEANAVILAHNHPSGEVKPSSSDRAVTKKIADALATIDVDVLDHVIIDGKNYQDTFSFADHSLI